MSESILLIEDEADLRMTLTDRLESEGYSVECSADGAEGLQKATSRPWSLIILDVMLPGKSGFDVCRDIRRAGQEMPIIMLTARGQLVDKILGLKIGADDYLTKPFELLELLARIEALLRRGAPTPRPATSRTMSVSSVTFEWIFAAPPSPAKDSLFRFPLVNFNCCATLSGIPEPRYPAMCCSKKSGATAKIHLPARWMSTWAACARSWNPIPNNPA